MRKRTTITAGLIALALAGLALAQKFGSYPENTTPAGGDLLLSVDISDPTDDPTGSSKYIDLDGVKSYALDGFDSSDLLDIAQHTGTLADLDSAIGLTGTADSSTYLRGDGAWVAVPTGGLGTNLSSSTDDILSDNGTMRFGGTGGTNNEGFDLDFETTANTVEWIPVNGATTHDMSALTLLLGALDISTLSADEFTPETGTDPDLDTAGQISTDTDDHVLRGYDGANQFAYGKKIHQIDVTVVAPNDLADAARDAFWTWSNQSGLSFVVTGWVAVSDTDDTSVNIEVVDSDATSNNATVDAVEITTGSGPYVDSDTTITAGTIAAGRMIVLDFDDTDAPGQVKLTLYGYYDADVD